MNNQKILIKTILCTLAFALPTCHAQQTPATNHAPDQSPEEKLLWFCQFGGEDPDTLNRIKILIHHKHANVNTTDADGRTPLMKAVANNHLQKVPLLLDAHADLTASSNDHQTALSIAVANDNLEMVKLLLPTTPQLNGDGIPLVGADPNFITHNKKPLLIVAIENMNPGIVEQLLQAGARPNQHDADGQTPLIAAARAGTPLIMEILIAYNADINATDTLEKRTPLMWAVIHNHPMAAALLIKEGANTSKKDIDGKTAQDLAKELYPDDEHWEKMRNII